MRQQPSVEIISSRPAVRRATRPRRTEKRPTEHSYAFVVALLTLVSTSVAIYDLFLLAKNAV